jgi:rhamnopyranosyl-N-acetylglucosaminyl-diphospho-decaprenol beta-1,3/1,4-galactofuranosyltransferase
MVTFNRLNRLRDTLPRLLAEPVDRVVVVDNASTDGTGDWLAGQTDPRLTVRRLADNMGGAGGFEAGLATLRDGPALPDGTALPDWTALLDDDAWPEAGTLGRLAGDLARPETRAAAAGRPIGAVVAAVTLPDGQVAEMNRPSCNPFWHPRIFARTLLGGGRGGFHIADADLAPGAPPRAVDVASFVGFVVHRDAVLRAGLPEGGLFIYGDDVLYSLRLRRAGLALLLLPDLRFVHDCGTMDARFVYRPLWKIYYHCRNGVSIARQAAGPIVFPAALAYYVTLWARRGRHCLPAERPIYRQLMWQGVRDGLRGRRGRHDPAHRLATSLAP